MAYYLGIPGYAKFFATLGFNEHDLADGGSDHIVDAIVAWGDESAFRARLEEHRRAGADQVCIVALDPSGGMRPHLRALEALAPKNHATWSEPSCSWPRMRATSSPAKPSIVTGARDIIEATVVR